MPTPVPTPVAAALGLVPTVLGGVRRLPGKAVQLPVYAVSYTLTGIGTARQGYDNLAERGERLIARLRGTSFDELEDSFEDRLQGTPLARPYDRVEDALEDATEGVASLARKSSARARKAAGTATRTVGGGLDKAADKTEEAAGKAGPTAERGGKTTGGATAKATPKPGKATAKAAATAEKAAGATAKAADKAAGATAKAADKAETKVEKTADEVEQTAEKAAGKIGKPAAEAVDKVQDVAVKAEQDVPAAEAPKGEPTPQASQPDHTRVGTAASADVVETVEEVSATVSGEVLPHDELPLPDYDHLTLGSLRGRMRSLDLPQLVQIRDYEKAHADRLPIVTMLDNRIAKLANDPTAPLSGGSPAADVPAKPAGAKGGSKVTADTQGPVLGTAPHGVPGNNQQPR